MKIKTIRVSFAFVIAVADDSPGDVAATARDHIREAAGDLSRDGFTLQISDYIPGSIAWDNECIPYGDGDGNTTTGAYLKGQQ